LVDLVNDGTGLQLSVQSCSVAWSATTTCAGDVRTVLASGPVLRSGDLAAPRSPAAGATDHLAVTVTLPSSAGDAFRAQASELHLVFTAEGIEDQATWNRLSDLGCDVAQGFFLCRPMPADQLERWFDSVGAPALT
jgi:hypothetical protein